MRLCEEMCEGKTMVSRCCTMGQFKKHPGVLR